MNLKLALWSTAAVLILLPSSTAAQRVRDYYLNSGFIPQTPSVTAGSVGAFYNPAAWGMQASTEVAFYYDDRDARSHSLDNWGLSVGNNVGFSMQTRTLETFYMPRVQDYQLGFAGGTRAFTLGASWRWSGGDQGLQQKSGLGLGFISRPWRHLTFGFSTHLAHFTNPEWGLADIGVRPFGTPLWTVYGDYSLEEGPYDSWGIGTEVRPIKGIHLGVTYRDGEQYPSEFVINMGVTVDRFGFHVMPTVDDDGEDLYSTQLLRFSPPHKGIDVKNSADGLFKRDDKVVPINLERKFITYQKVHSFDSYRVGWLDLASQLDEALRNENISGVALNLSGTRMRPSLGWELREKLKELQAAGKRVYIHGDRFNMGSYFVASVADYLTLDPIGDIRLPGFALHRTYYKGLLEKIGVGSQEWRMFSHKTAFQGFTRTDMSEADKEQLGAVLDVVYETWRDGVSESRGLSAQAIDGVVNDDVFILAKKAVDRGLIDAAGRWDDLMKHISEQDELSVESVSTVPNRGVYPDQRWGLVPEIAVVYTVGRCAMDSGIRGRETAKYVNGLAKKRNLAALVVRVDSPGGDPLPSDLVAGGMRKVKEKDRPVIISQGDVAASGGYWLSMEGDDILTTPWTITGSIGVIAGWFYDDGFSGKTGLTADGVQRGEHADLFTGISLPLLPRPLPERNLTEEELRGAMEVISDEYDMFVKGVAEGRGLTESRVRELAEGRVWMGPTAMENGLVDSLGGLIDAINLAREKAGIAPDDEYTISVYPEPDLFKLPSPVFNPLNFLIGKDAVTLEDAAVPQGPQSYDMMYLGVLAAGMGSPMLILPPDYLPEGWFIEE